MYRVNFIDGVGMIFSISREIQFIFFQLFPFPKRIQFEVNHRQSPKKELAKYIAKFNCFDGY